MILIKVVQSVVDLRILQVDIGSEFDLAREIGTPRLFAQVVIAHFVFIQWVRLVKEEVTERREEDKRQQHNREATAPGRCYDLVTHYIVQHSLFIS